MSAVGALAIFTGLSVVSQVYGGQQAQRSANEQASLLREQAQIERNEAEREAQRKEEERQKFIAKQKVAYLANGIGLQGTAGLVLEDTYDQFTQEINAVRKSGSAQARLLEKEASIKQKTGRASLISGVLGGASTIAGSYYTGKVNKLF